MENKLKREYFYPTIGYISKIQRLENKIKPFPVWLRNLLLSTVLKPILSQTEKSCIASNHRQFCTNIKIKFIKLKPVFHFDIHGKMSIYNTMR